MMSGEMAWLIIYAALIGGLAWVFIRYRTFFREAWRELRDKVTWPGWKEVRGTTIVVVILVFAVSAFLFVCDYIFGPTIETVIELFQGL
jgi:preprotein translocase SecE subunit